MKDVIAGALAKATTLREVKELLVPLLEKTYKKEKRIGYVSGIIFSDGPLHVKRNIQALSDYTDFLRSKHSFSIFSPVDVFYGGLFSNLKESSFPPSARRIVFISFWRDILTSGFVTDIFMTPRWQQSEGATDEHNIAKEKGITIHYVS